MKNLIRTIRKGRFSRKLIKRFTSWVAILVVFTTTYMLILPAIAIDNGTAAAEPGLALENSPAVTGLAQEDVPADPVYTLACGYHVHQHEEGCYAERDILDTNGNPTGAKEKVLICGRSDQVVHEHDASCWQNGVLVCQLPENKAHTHACRSIPTTMPVTKR